MNTFSFRCPVHQSPAAIAHSFDKKYEPLISLKIDGIFNEFIKSDTNQTNHLNYYPNFPESWTKIEGELYVFDRMRPILYIFYVEKSSGFESVEQMYLEIETYFIDQINKITDKLDLSSKKTIQEDIINNINQSYRWLEIASESPNGLIWFPKKYWKLDTSNWNLYIDQLDDLFQFAESEQVKSLINHDGLVISPNVPSYKKSLIKLKPKHELTIDLFFNGKKFFSRNRTDYSNIIGEYKKSDYDYGAVYRLAPGPNHKYVPVYKREATKKPNPDNIINDILYKYYNYFELSQLKDLYNTPWYSTINPDGYVEMTPVFNYCQHIYNSVLSQMNNGLILDIGCGAMGQYHKHFLNPRVQQYIGLDIDLAKLHESQVKVSYNDKLKFMLCDISYQWNKQNDRFQNDIWKTYYNKMAKLNQKFDNIISIFSSQYTNSNKSSWYNYVSEINFRSISGTRLFFMWIDCSKIKSDDRSKYYNYDKKNNILNINLPHKESHSEPGLGNEIFESFVNVKNDTNRWVIDNTIQKFDELQIDKNLPIYSYIKLVNWIVLVKV